MGLKEVAQTLFNTVSKANFEKFFYYIEVRFPDGFTPEPRPVIVTDDKTAGVPYVNKYLYILETDEPLLLSEHKPGPGSVQLIDHGLTYWGQLRALGFDDHQIKSEPPGWKQSIERSNDARLSAEERRLRAERAEEQSWKLWGLR